MISRHRLPGRRGLPVLAVGVTLALGGGFAIDSVSASAQTVNAQPQQTQQQQSQNWAGYVVHSSNGSNFSSVSGSWTQPAVSSTSGQGYSAFWVGLGGAGQQSQALEQVGTSSDVVDGQATYYAWYELVPAPETQLNLAIHPGDHITGKVTVNGSSVTVSLSDQTTGQSVSKTATTSNPDTSTAEWIAEAPSSQSSDGSIQTLPLANFGTVTFTGASATAGGHTGSISDPAWNSTEVQLTPDGSTTYPGAGGSFTLAGLGSAGQPSGGATPSALSSDGSSFSVSYSAAPTATETSSGSSAGNSAGGYPGGGSGYGGYPGGGYAGGGYGYGGYPGGGYGGAGNGYGGGYGYGAPGGGYGYSYGGPGGYVVVF
jgi:Peptidase A4 family